MSFDIGAYYYRPPTKLGEGNVFTGVCLFTWGRYVWYQVPSGGGWVCESGLGMCGGDVLGWYSPPPVLTSSGATEAGGMHHTGMHSCILRI